MHLLGCLALLTLPVVIVASPFANSPGPKISSFIDSVECSAVGFIVNTLKAYPSATSFCSSYIAISTTTTTITQTSTSVVPTILTTVTSTSISTFTAVVTSTTSTAITTCTATPVSTPTATAAPFKARRAIEDRAVDNKPCTTSLKSTSTTVRATATTTPCPNTTGKPQSAPTLPSCVSSFEGAAISQACSCLAVPTPTSTTYATVVSTKTSTSITSVVSTASTTVTTTTTITATSTSNYCPVTTSCSNQGLQWAAYNNTSGNDDGGSDKYSNFLPETYKTQQPLYTSTTTTVGLNVSDSGAIISIYGSPAEFESELFILNHRGYLLAQETGTYTFSASSVDDTVCVWLGSDAYTGWMRGNDNLDASYDNGPGSQTITYSLTAGEYLPIRIVFAQAQGAAEFGLSITAPNGSSPQFVQCSCDGRTAPAYAEPFGAET